MKRMALETQGGHLGGCHLLPRRVIAGVEEGPDLESSSSSRVADQIDDGFVADQGLASPVHADERKEAVLNRVPLARPGRVVADRDRNPYLGRQPLEVHLPGAESVPVAPAGIGA